MSEILPRSSKTRPWSEGPGTKEDISVFKEKSISPQYIQVVDP